MIIFLENLLELCLEAAPWLVLGLIIGGLIKALVPTSFLNKHLSGNGFVSVSKAALFGAPLPLCSCGVIPAALGLRRAGASKPATISFLVSTPETGVDSVTISYALLGPFMAIVRPIAAIISAITAGMLVSKADETVTSSSHTHDHSSSCCETEKVASTDSCCSSEAAASSVSSCCDSDDKKDAVSPSQEASCCSSDSCDTTPDLKTNGFVSEAWAGIKYSFNTLFVDVLFWLVIGLVFAALVKTFVPVTFLAEYGSGFPAMLIMLVIGIPMYVCATASTPIAAGLLLAGVSPGTAMVFLMAGPATNISTLGVIGKELGKQPLIAYLVGVGFITLLTGLAVDAIVEHWNINVQAQIVHSQDLVPPVVSWASLLMLVAVVAKLKLGRFFQGASLA